jgi:hypothetical protein
MLYKNLYQASNAAERSQLVAGARCLVSPRRREETFIAALFWF